MFILKKGHQPGVYVPLRALFLVLKNVYVSHNFKPQVLDLLIGHIRNPEPKTGFLM